MRTLVIGVGNLLRCDDGAGIHVVNRLREIAPDINVEDVALGSIEILEAMKGYEQVIIVDAIKTGANPGTIYNVNLSKEEKPPNISTSHGIDLITTLELGRRLFPEEMPKKGPHVKEIRDYFDNSVNAFPKNEKSCDDDNFFHWGQVIVGRIGKRWFGLVVPCFHLGSPCKVRGIER